MAAAKCLYNPKTFLIRHIVGACSFSIIFQRWRKKKEIRSSKIRRFLATFPLISKARLNRLLWNLYQTWKFVETTSECEFQHFCFGSWSYLDLIISCSEEKSASFNLLNDFSTKLTNGLTWNLVGQLARLKFRRAYGQSSSSIRYAVSSL